MKPTRRGAIGLGGAALAVGVEFIENAKITAAERKAIFETNAARF